MPNSSDNKSVQIAIAWCLAWGEAPEPKHPITADALRQAVLTGKPADSPALQAVLKQTEALLSLSESDFAFPKNRTELEQLKSAHEALWASKIGLVYGGVTKVKSYVFESADLHEIRGASGLLDRINLVDLPAFFHAETSNQFPQCQQATEYCSNVIRENWLKKHFSGLSDALIPELIIYSTGGNILAFCPVAYAEQLADAIERRYTEETLTANSCAVARSFRLLETRLGLLPEEPSQTRWLDWYLENRTHPLMPQLLGTVKNHTLSEDKVKEIFEQQKSFSELVTQLTIAFEQRRSGQDAEGSVRPSRRYPPMFETHPYLQRDENEQRSAIFKAKNKTDDKNAGLPGEPWFSEVTARKRLMGQLTKRNFDRLQWWTDSKLEWPSVVPEGRFDKSVAQSWVKRFEDYLEKPDSGNYYPTSVNKGQVEESRSLQEIADSSIPHGSSGNGFVGFIYADGNNMGGYIRRKIKTPQEYKAFSKDVFEATIVAVYKALRKHLKPRRYKPDASSSRENKKEIWLYPFEIVAVGGDDVMLVVPADKAIAVAETLAKEFEEILGNRYQLTDTAYVPKDVHRYHADDMPTGIHQSELSMSAGVLIAAKNTPFYYAEELTQQLMKSAKKRAKKLREKNYYYGGTVDFLVMKSVTMISSNIQQFRSQGLTRAQIDRPTLKQYAAPYTIYELGKLLKTAQVLKGSDFPKSQLYQIRSLLERGKQTAILNYRYFRLRLANKAAQQQLETIFEKGWCQPKDSDNRGNLAPWMSYQETDPTTDPAADSDKRTAYETIWRELVDLYPFIPETPLESETPLETEDSTADSPSESPPEEVRS